MRLLLALLIGCCVSISKAPIAAADGHLEPCYRVTSVTICGVTHEVCISDDGKYWEAYAGEVKVYCQPVKYCVTHCVCGPICSCSPCSCVPSSPVVVAAPNPPTAVVSSAVTTPQCVGGQCYQQPVTRRFGGGHSPQYLQGSENVQIQQKVVQLGIANRVGVRADSGDDDNDRSIGGGPIRNIIEKIRNRPSPGPGR